MQEKRIHEAFRISVLLKGAHAIFECVSALVLAFVTLNSIRSLVSRLTQNKSFEEKHDFIAAQILHWSQGFSIQSKHFYAFYLLSHGVVKLFLVAGLLREKLWAYPASLGVMGLFIGYQLYRFSYTHGVGLILLTIFDLVVIALVWHEYRLVRHHLPAK